MRKINLMRRGILLISVGFLSAACATIFSGCPPQADDRVTIYGFDVNQKYVYHGKKDGPDSTIEFGDAKLEKMVAMFEEDWNHVLSRLATCH